MSKHTDVDKVARSAGTMQRILGGPGSANGRSASSRATWPNRELRRSAHDAGPPGTSGSPSCASTAEVTHIDPPRTWRVRGINGPIRSVVEVTVEPEGEDQAHLTIVVNFTGHGLGSCSFR